MNEDNAGSNASPASRVRILGSLRAHRRLAIMVFLVIMIPGAAFSWVHGRPRYVSVASIQVQQAFASTMEEDAELRGRATRYRDFLQQQMLNILRLEVLEEALVALGDENRWQLPGESLSRAAERLQATLGVIPLHGAQQIDVELEGDSPEGLAEIVNAVIDTYVVVHRGETIIGGDERFAALEEYHKKEAVEVRSKLGDKAKLAQEIGVSNFDVTVANPHQSALLAASSALGEARQRVFQTESRVAALESKQESVLELEIHSQARLAVAEDEAIAELLRKLVERRNELMAQKVGLTSSHPGYTEATQQIAELDAAINATRDEAIAAAAEVLEQRRRTEAAEALARARIDAEEAQLVVASLVAEVEHLRKQVGEFVSSFETGRQLEDDIMRHRTNIRDALDRRDSLELEAQSPGYARIGSRARQPEVPSRGGRLKFLVAFAVLAAFVAVGSTIVVDLLDRRIHSADDLERTFGFPPLGWILDPQDDRSTRFAEDQVRRLALAIDREHRTKGTKRFVLLGIRPDAGTSDLIERIGRELAAVGSNALTVDANARHRSTVSGQAGLVDLLEQRVGTEQAIVTGTPSHVFLGNREEGRRTLPAAHRLRGLLDELSTEFDVVLIDAPPLMMSSDAEMLVGLSDATLLLVVAEAEEVDEITEAVSVLERLAPPVVGVILNRVHLSEHDTESMDILQEHDTGVRARPSDSLGRWLSA